MSQPSTNGSDKATARLNFKVLPEEKEWIDENHRLQGFQTTSKLMAHIMREYIKACKDKEAANLAAAQEDRPKSPEEELNLLVERMGTSEDRWQNQFEAIRSLIPPEAKFPENDSELKQLMAAIWTEVINNNGFVESGKGKGVAITREDLSNYEDWLRLALKKEALKKEIETNSERK